MALTDKQQRFVEEYCVDWNATQAAIRAGYSEHSAFQTGAENLKKPKVAAAIEERKQALNSAAEISSEKTLREVAALAFSDMSDYVTIRDDGQVILDFANLPPDALKCVRKIKQEVILTGDPNDAMPIQKTEFELYDKRGPLDMLMKHFGQYEADNTRDVNVRGHLTVDTPPRAQTPDEWLAIKERVQAAQANRVAEMIDD